MSFSFGYPYPLPDTKGWGSGWPNCQRDKVRPHEVFQGGVHEDVFDLVNLIVGECERRGYVFHDGWSWGFGCRCMKTSSGAGDCIPGKDKASIHSWALALDFNAPQNVFGADKSESDIATNHPWLPKLMAEYGFNWLGPSIGDWMHFHFAGSPIDAKLMTEKAFRELGGGEDDEMFEQWHRGWDYHESGREFNDEWPAMVKQGWRDRNVLLRDARNLPT